jgi:hypothetical protein
MVFRLIVAAVVLVGLLSAPAIGLTTRPWPETAPDCSALTSALRSGSAFVCRQPSTADPAFEAEHRFRCDEDQRCTYTQTLPRERALWCRFTEAGRAAFAAAIEAGAHEPAAMRECELRDRDGAIIPFEGARNADHAH